mgnify:CR=1 FL=1
MKELLEFLFFFFEHPAIDSGVVCGNRNQNRDLLLIQRLTGYASITHAPNHQTTYSWDFETNRLFSSFYAFLFFIFVIMIFGY